MNCGGDGGQAPGGRRCRRPGTRGRCTHLMAQMMRLAESLGSTEERTLSLGAWPSLVPPPRPCYGTASYNSRAGTRGRVRSGCVPSGSLAVAPLCAVAPALCPQRGCVATRHKHASLLAADLWHAHTRGVSTLSTPVSYVNQHTETKNFGSPPPQAAANAPVSLGTTFPRTPYPWLLGRLGQ